MSPCCDETPAAGDPPHRLCKKVKYVRPTVSVVSVTENNVKPGEYMYKR